RGIVPSGDIDAWPEPTRSVSEKYPNKAISRHHHVGVAVPVQISDRNGEGARCNVEVSLGAEPTRAIRQKNRKRVVIVHRYKVWRGIAVQVSDRHRYRGDTAHRHIEPNAEGERCSRLRKQRHTQNEE